MKRLFLDANVIIDGVLAEWSLSRAVLMLCSRHVYRLTLSDYVVDEVETALLRLATKGNFSKREATRLLGIYDRWLELTNPQMISVASHEAVWQRARIIHHLHDVPVLAAALKAAPDWVLSLNRKHFSNQVAARTSLRIASPHEFFRILCA